MLAKSGSAQHAPPAEKAMGQVTPLHAQPARGLCPHCSRTFDDHTFIIDTLTVQCPDHEQTMLVDWVQPPQEPEAVSVSTHPQSTLLGTRFDSLDQQSVADHIMRALATSQGGLVVPTNVDVLRLMALDEKYEELVHHASLVLVDGAPLQWAARMSGQGHVDRTPGSTLMLPLAAAAAGHGRPMLLLGGRDGAAEQAASALRDEVPGLDVRWHCPPWGFENDPVQWRIVEEHVEACRGGLVMCGLGAPKQELVGMRLLAANPDTWFLSVGATIDFTAGMVTRAPEWMQHWGLEWLYRLAIEPRRLFRRYIVDDLPFVAKLLSWAVRKRFRAPAAIEPAETTPVLEREVA